jgi:hypothetical protein
MAVTPVSIVMPAVSNVTVEADACNDHVTDRPHRQDVGCQRPRMTSTDGVHHGEAANLHLGMGRSRILLSFSERHRRWIQ